MILKGSQRAGPRQLAVHLLNDRDNDHVEVQELRGFVAGDLHGARVEAQAIAIVHTRTLRERTPIYRRGLMPYRRDVDRHPDEVRKRKRVEPARRSSMCPKCFFSCHYRLEAYLCSDEYRHVDLFYHCRS